MDESPGSLMDKVGLHVPDILDQHVSLASITSVPAVNPKALTQNGIMWSQETVSRTSSTLRPIFLRPRNDQESTGTSHDEYQPLENNDAKPEPLQRKGHTKSRRGCYNCKTRRVKCPENHPVCTQCTRRGLKCKWPELHISQAGKATQKSPPILQQVELSTPIFTPQDFRLFHHFIHDAYPVKPVGNESIWTHEVPSISHNYDYLLHAMLALSASDLEASSSQPSSELTQSSMIHRIQAIKSLNSALSAGMRSLEDGNAMLATCFILVYQSTYIDKGVPEYLTFVRGCTLVSLQMGQRGLKMLFRNLFTDEEIERTRLYAKGIPEIDLGPVDAAYASLEAMAHLCERESEKMLREETLGIVRKFYVSSCDAYMAWMKGSVIFSRRINHAEFLSFIDPSNPVGRLLQSHLVAVQTLIGHFGQDERGSRKASQFLDGMVRWLEVLHADIEPEMRSYFEWPIYRAQELRGWLQHEKTLVKT